MTKNYTPFRVRVKLLIKSIVPKKIFEGILFLWRKTGSKMITDIPTIRSYEKEFVNTHGFNVTGGPFSGLKYVKRAAGSGFLVKLVGSYEEILQEEIERYKKRNYTTIIDIGCAEGYYLIGLGRDSKSSTLVGYDIDESALALTKELYTINNLQNKLILEKECTPATLAKHIEGKTLVICDAEGFENEILDPSKTQKLKDVQTILVELHDFVIPGIKEILINRFGVTHTVKTIVFKHADKDNYPFLRSMKNKKDLYAILRERGEQEQEWLVFEKK